MQWSECHQRLRRDTHCLFHLRDNLRQLLVVRNVEVYAQLPALGVEPDHSGYGIFPDAPHQAATPRWRENVNEKDDCQVGPLVPLQHGNGSLEHELIRFIDTARVAPPIQPGILSNLAEHLQFVVSRRFLEIMHHNMGDTLEQTFIVLPLVRERPITIVLCNVMLDADAIDAGRHGINQLVKGSM